MSTEAVFSGDGRARSETSRPDPVWDYGRWKVAAEDTVQCLDPNAAIIRLPLIISRAPEDNILSDIRRGLERDEPSVWFTDEMRRPANAADLAHAIWAIAALPAASRAGIWHLPGPERLSRSEIAARALDAVGLDRSAILTAPTPLGAQRPRDLNLTGSRAERQIDWTPRPIHALCARRGGSPVGGPTGAGSAPGASYRLARPPCGGGGHRGPPGPPSRRRRRRPGCRRCRRCGRRSTSSL
ncbi:MAG: sugar nucleotide-binding protein [Acidimicrobiales bacterium]